MDKNELSSIDKIWEGDCLGRKEDALYLQNYLSQRYKAKKNEPGFVLAVNADWGTGKTFMLERWRRQIMNQQFPSVYFDAWQNDYTKDPLLAFIAELDAGLKAYFKEIPVAATFRDEARKAFKQMWKPALKVIGYALVKHMAGISANHLHSMFDDDADQEDDNSEGDQEDEGNSSEASEKTSDFKKTQEKLKKAIEEELKKHKTVKRVIAEFKEKLSLLIDTLDRIAGFQLPLIIFIDELDRCRPDYAIELLEGIKHLFGVPGVYFVIATNVNQLSHSIKAVYGTDFDGQTYLKRFFDLQYSLPEPSYKQFSDALVEKMTLPPIEIIVYGLQGVYGWSGEPLVNHTPKEVFSFVLGQHADEFDLSLRDLLQITTMIEAALFNLVNKRIHVFFLIFLTVVYHLDPVAYRKIVQVKNLNEAAGFGNLKYRKRSEMIEIPDRQNKSNPKKISLVQIAGRYFKFLTMTDDDWRAEYKKDDLYVFPENLIPIGRDLAATISEFQSYLTLIPNAGKLTLISKV